MKQTKIKEERVCLNCGETFESVTTISATKHHYFCSDCNKKLSANERRNLIFKNYPEKRQLKNARNKQHHKDKIVHYMWYRAKQRAKKYNLDFDIQESDIIIPEKCPILEVPIILGNKDNYEYTPSLDRIDNSKGYVKGNIQVISKKANSMKNSATYQELITFCKKIILVLLFQ